MHTFSVGEGQFKLTAYVIPLDEGLTITLAGGKSHVGSTVMSIPRPSLADPQVTSCTSSVLNQLGHKDDSLALLFAEAICIKFKIPVVATAGVHIHEACKEDVQLVLSNAQKLLEIVLDALSF
jgi:hypothetical protein